MFQSNRYLLSREIAFMNQTDLVILPSQKMADFLYAEGLTVKKTVIQRMWDFPVSIDQSFRPQFGKVVNFAAKLDAEKFSFAKEWMENQTAYKFRNIKTKRPDYDEPAAWHKRSGLLYKSNAGLIPCMVPAPHFFVRLRIGQPIRSA